MLNSIARISVTTLMLWLDAGTMVHSASFDCEKAVTETEKTICADPELSKFDEEIAEVYFSLDKLGRYYDAIVANQRLWVREERRLHGYDFGRQLWYLKITSTLNRCVKGEADFEDCYHNALELVEKCYEEDNYTTYIMNRCGSSLNDALSTILIIETEMWQKINDYDTETLELFNIAAEKWNSFAAADCEWQYSEYRDFSKRNQIWLGCSIEHRLNRINLLNSSNRFQGKDIPFLKSAE